MDTLLWSAVIGAGAGLCSAAVGAGTAGWVARQERKSRAKDERVRQLAATNHALDLLAIELRQLPRTTRSASAADRLLSAERTPNLYAVFAWANRRTLGRDVQLAVHRFNEAGHRLVLVGSESVAQGVLAITEVLGDGIEEPGWEERLAAARRQLAAAGNQQLRE